MKLSNCLFEAWKHWSAGSKRPPEEEIYIWIRRSRYRWSPFHMGWGTLDHESGLLKLQSFKPLTPVNVPWWKSWTRLFFHGVVIEGDKHHI